VGSWEDWSKTKRVLFSDLTLRNFDEPPQAKFEKKNPEIPTLPDYRSKPSPSFWTSFPFRKCPKKPSARLNVDSVENEILECKENFTCHQQKRGSKLLHDLRNGASSYQKTSLPAETTQNSKSAYVHGEMLTDKISSWVKDGLVCGPFESAPFPGFRSNPLMAVDRNNSIRPVINMSGPKGGSFNENLDKLQMEKVKMASAKSFSFAVKSAGVGALMSKYDLKDAFKIIPARASDWRLQGFNWLGRFFFESQMIFGAAPSVSNFDRLGSTLADMALSKSGTNRKWLHRTLDDFAFVSPKNSGFTEKFSAEFSDLCNRVEVKTAPVCPDKEKAFVLETSGIVLGIGFNTEKLEWFLTKKKSECWTNRIWNGINNSHIDLKRTEQIMGTINNLAQMFPLLKPFQASGNRLLAKFNQNYNILLMPSKSVKDDWLVCGRACLAAQKGVPIAD